MQTNQALRTPSLRDLMMMFLEAFAQWRLQRLAVLAKKEFMQEKIKEWTDTSGPENS